MRVTIEIPMYQKYKYEMDKETGVLFLNRELNQIVPSNYGFFSGTLAEDGDPLDCFVLSEYPLLAGSQCEVKFFGAFLCTDQGVPDHKLICTLGEELPNSVLEELDRIENYLKTYKKGFKVLKWADKFGAKEIFEKSVKALGSENR